jgi:hypothetical protein
VSRKVVLLIVPGFIAVLKMAVNACVGGTPLALLTGTVDTTVGGMGGVAAAAVVKDHT